MIFFHYWVKTFQNVAITTIFMKFVPGWERPDLQLIAAVSFAVEGVVGQDHSPGERPVHVPITGSIFWGEEMMQCRSFGAWSDRDKKFEANTFRRNHLCSQRLQEHLHYLITYCRDRNQK